MDMDKICLNCKFGTDDGESVKYIWCNRKSKKKSVEKTDSCNNFEKAEQKYFVVSNEHTDSIVRSFWKKGFNGYTIDLGDAGAYTLDDMKNYRDNCKKDDGSYSNFEIIDMHNINDRGKYRDFLIAVNDIYLLGKVMICVLN